jgi:hypothetical protein
MEKMTEKKFQNFCEETRVDLLADFPDADCSEFYDLVEGLIMSDTELRNFLQKKLKTKNKEILKGYLAEFIKW